MKEFYTERLFVRRFRESDGEALYQYLSDEEVVQFEPYDPMTREEALREAARREGDEQFWAVCLKDGTLIGNLYCEQAEFHAREVGYVFNRAYWGSGYATEALRAMIAHAFDDDHAHRVFAMCDALNPHSWRLLERVGMRREANLLQNAYFHISDKGEPIWKDTYIYAILSNERASLKD